MHRDYETIIIGGGAVGSGIAYHLSEAGVEGVAVIDQGFPMCGTTGATYALIWVQGKTPAWYGELSSYSAALYKDLDRKLGGIEYRPSGGMSVFFTEQERETAKALAESQAAAGIEIEVLNRDQALMREPALSPQILGATYCALDGNVNPLRLVQQYMRMAKRQGVTYEVYNRVTSIEKKKGAFTIQTQKGTFGCKTLVISAGPQAQEIGKMLAIDIPVRPVRGQAMITEAVAPLFRHTIFSGVRQMVNGEVFVGSSKEEGQLDRSTTLDFLGRAAELGMKKVPNLANVKVIRSFAGLRPMPKDGHPILGPVPGVENLYVAAMHSGVTLSPLVGTLMTELLTHGETSIPIQRLSITRFA